MTSLGEATRMDMPFSASFSSTSEYSRVLLDLALDNARP